MTGRRRRSGRVGGPQGPPVRRVTDREARAERASVLGAPVMDLSPGGMTLEVKRVGLLKMPDGLVPYLETTTSEFHRMPPGLEGWAYDTVALAIAMRVNPFPSRVHFWSGDDGHNYAEILD